MRKVSLILSIFIFLFLINIKSANALTINSTYRDVSPSSSQSSNLLALAQNYDTFKESDFVIFSDSQYSYYIVWSKDLSLSNGTVKGSNIEYIRYLRDNNYDYSYTYGKDSSFNLNSTHLDTSSINGYGFVSLANMEYYHYLNYDTNSVKYEQFLIVGLALLFGIFLLRGGHF